MEVHYVENKNDEELLELSKGMRIIAIPEESAMIVEDRKICYTDRIWLFDNGEKTIIN